MRKELDNGTDGMVPRTLVDQPGMHLDPGNRGRPHSVSLFPRAERRSGSGFTAAGGHVGGDPHRRRDRRGARQADLQERRSVSAGSGLRLSGLHAGGRARAADDHRRAHHRLPGASAGKGAAGIRTGLRPGPERGTAGAAAAERLADERRQHHAGRSHGGGTGVYRTARAHRRGVRIRLSRGSRTALFRPTGGYGPGRGAVDRQPLPAHR